MTKAPKNVVTSVLARLRNVTQEAGLSFNDILQSYVIVSLSTLAIAFERDLSLVHLDLYLVLWNILGNNAANAAVRLKCKGFTELHHGPVFSENIAYYQ